MNATHLVEKTASPVDTDLVTELSIRKASEISDAPTYRDPQGGIGILLISAPKPKPSR